MTRIISATCGEPRERDGAQHNLMTPCQHDTQHSRNHQAEPPDLPPELHHPSHRMRSLRKKPQLQPARLVSLTASPLPWHREVVRIVKLHIFVHLI